VKDPFISVIIPVYNGEKIIEECIQSLMNQSYLKEQYEIIVVDNNSTDHTAAIIKKLPVVYQLQDKIQSAYASRNAGSELAQGEALLFFDADEIASYDLLKEFSISWNEKEYVAFQGMVKPISDVKTVAGQYWHIQEQLDFENQHDYGNFPKLGGGNTLIRKNVFDKIGRYDQGLVSWGDFDLSYRLFKAGHKVKNMGNAIIHHKERASVKRLLKREYRIGFGRSHFGTKHKDLKESLMGIFLKALQRTFVGLLALVWGLVKPLKDKSRKQHLGLILLDMGMRWAYFYGRVYFYSPMSQKNVMAKW